MIETIAAAAAGGFAWWQCRDDDTEKVAGLPLTTSTWKGIITACSSPLFYLQSHGLLEAIVAIVAFVLVLTAPHNLLLSPPRTQIIEHARDVLQELLFKAFGKAPGDTLGLAPYVVYSVFRYCIPIQIMGLALHNPFLVVAGPIVSLGYYPWIHSEASKYYRAGFAGMVITGALAAGAF